MLRGHRIAKWIQYRRCVYGRGFRNVCSHFNPSRGSIIARKQTVHLSVFSGLSEARQKCDAKPRANRWRRRTQFRKNVRLDSNSFICLTICCAIVVVLHVCTISTADCAAMCVSGLFVVVGDDCFIPDYVRWTHCWVRATSDCCDTILITNKCTKRFTKLDLARDIYWFYISPTFRFILAFFFLLGFLPFFHSTILLTFHGNGTLYAHVLPAHIRTHAPSMG